MFIGHYALGFAAKRAAPRAGLGGLFVAPPPADRLRSPLLLSGLEHVHAVPSGNPFLNLWFDDYPYSHSLFTLIVWGIVFGYVYRAATGYKRGAFVIGILVVSHWVLDFVTHRPDMPLYHGGPQLGLGLWISPAAPIAVEAAMMLVGVTLYARTTRARDAAGQWGFLGLVALLAISYGVSLEAPPPPNHTALAIGGIIFGWVFVVFAWWVDRHREAVQRVPTL